MNCPSSKKIEYLFLLQTGEHLGVAQVLANRLGALPTLLNLSVICSRVLNFVRQGDNPKLNAAHRCLNSLIWGLDLKIRGGESG